METGTPEENYLFDNCWVEKNMPLAEITLGGTTFRMRAITAGEYQEVRARARIKPQGTLSLQDAASRVYDGYNVIVGDVAASLGAYTKIGDEGWSDPRPVTEENVRKLHARVLFALNNKASEFFLGGSGRPAELGTSVVVDSGAVDEKPVP